MKWGVVTFPAQTTTGTRYTAWRAYSGRRRSRCGIKTGICTASKRLCCRAGFPMATIYAVERSPRFSPVMSSVMAFAGAGGPVLGMCNGFQILCESGLLPGALVRNRSLSFICEWVSVRVETTRTRFTARCAGGACLSLPIKHGAGCYVADETTLKALQDNDQIVFRYVNQDGEALDAANPNGAVQNIAGVTNANGNVVGLMPHPEHAVEALLGGEDGRTLFTSVFA